MTGHEIRLSPEQLRELARMVANEFREPPCEWLTAKAFCNEYGYARGSVKNLVSRYGLPCHRVGRKMRFLRSEVEVWAANHGRRRVSR